MNILSKILFLSALAVLLVGTGAATCNKNNSTHAKETNVFVPGKVKPVPTKKYKCYISWYETTNFDPKTNTCRTCGCPKTEHTP